MCGLIGIITAHKCNDVLNYTKPTIQLICWEHKDQVEIFQTNENQLKYITVLGGVLVDFIPKNT